ncbi:MAG: hypothetical protein KAX28_03820 [Candidatus Marinimicrobia bacterium]|nr:hypothetical protein [Candidatus Neomarinimicrobiota bacterium]
MLANKNLLFLIFNNLYFSVLHQFLKSYLACPAYPARRQAGVRQAADRSAGSGLIQRSVPGRLCNDLNFIHNRK